MEKDLLTTALSLILIFGLTLGLLLVAYEDGIPLGLYKKIRCRLGWHKTNRLKIRKYYCQFCKKPRKYPRLKVIDGTDKIRNNDHKF